MSFPINIFIKFLILGCAKLLARFFFLQKRIQVWEEAFALRYLGSNHPRRPIYYFRHPNLFGVLQKLKLLPSQADTPDLDYDFYLQNNGTSELKNEHLIFIGDSHVEFLSRIKITSSDHFFKNTSAIWLGPKTLMGYAHDPNIEERARRLAFLLKPLINQAKIKKKHVRIIWCMGTIDIRSSFYELILRKVAETEEDALDLFEKAAEIIITRHMPKVFEYLDRGQFEFSFAGCTSMLWEGDCPTTIKEIKRHRETELFPTFGTARQRDKWTVEANARLVSLCKKYNLRFFKFVLNEVRDDRMLFAKDGCHLTDPQKLREAVSAYLRPGGNSDG